MKREYWLALSLAGLLMMMPLGWASLALLLFVPGLSILLLIKDRTSLVELIAFSFTISILMFPLAVLVTSQFAPHIAPYVLGIIAIAAGLYNYSRSAGLEIEKSDWPVMAVALLIFALVFVISLKMFAISDGNLICSTTHASDLNFHLSIIQRYITDPAIPPQDPYLPGTSIVYQWFMHLTIGELCYLTGADLFLFIKILIPLISALIFLGAYMLALLIFNNDMRAAFVGGLIYVAYSGLSWAYILFQYWIGVQPDVFKILVYDWPGLMSLKYDPVPLYFFLPQTQTFGLLAIIFGLYLFAISYKERSVKYSIVAGIVLASLLLFHMISAFPVLLALGLFFLYAAFKERDLFITLILIIPLIMAGISGLYQLSLMSESAGSQIVPGHHPSVLSTTVVSIGLLIPFAIYGMYKKRQDDLSLLLIIYALLNLIFINIFELPVTVNTYRFLVYAALPLSLFAGLVLSGMIFSQKLWLKALAAIIILLMIPSTAFMVLFYNDSSYTHATPADVKAISWLKENTPKNSIIFEEPSHFPRVPVLSGRQVLYAGELYTIQYHGVDKQAEMESLLKISDPSLLYGNMLQYGVNYIFVGSKEAYYPFTAALTNGTYFREVYNEGGTKIYEVTGVEAVKKVNKMDISALDWIAFAAAFLYLLFLPGMNIMRTLGWDLKKYNYIEYIMIAFGISVSILVLVSLMLALPFSIGINFLTLMVSMTVAMILTSREIAGKILPMILKKA
jgi:hypothetical protein